MDGAFHLTPLDVRRYDFGTALRGYDKARVDQFREQVATELERLTRSNQELESKARTLAEQLKSFRDRDKAMNDALVSAQQLRSEMQQQADRERELVLKEARVEGARIIEESRGNLRQLEEEVAALGRMRRSYIAQLRSILSRQLAELDAAESTLPPVELVQDDEPAEHGPTRPASATPAWLSAIPKE